MLTFSFLSRSPPPPLTFLSQIFTGEEEEEKKVQIWVTETMFSFLPLPPTHPNGIFLKAASPPWLEGVIFAIRFF